MTYLRSLSVVAAVRESGAIGVFEKKVFHLALDTYATAEQQQIAAIAVLRDRGFEVNHVEIFQSLEA